MITLLPVSADAWLEPGFEPVWEKEKPGATITNALGMEFVYIPPGTFMMGSPTAEKDRESDEKQHRVALSRGYYMQTTEVTQGQWRAVMGTRPWSGKKYVREGKDYPAVYVSWEDAQSFIRKLNSQTGQVYRLPTEAEWEYACRAGSDTAYSFGDSATSLGRYAWFSQNAWNIGEEYAHPVARKQPNAWGLYDMHGNVWEWCQDWKGDYPSGSVTDPAGPSSGSGRVNRGGSCHAYARYCRSADRYYDTPDYRYSYLGFRLARLQ